MRHVTFPLLAIIGLLLVITLPQTGGISLKEVQMELKQRIEETQMFDAVDLVIVLDDSKSIRDPDFDLEKKAAKNIIETYSKVGDLRVGILKFGSKITSVAHLSKNYDAAKASIEGIEREVSVQNPTWFDKFYGTPESQTKNLLPEALLDTETLIQRYSREGSKRVVFVLTDGKPASSEVVDIANRLKFVENVVIFGIGIGSVNRSEIERITSYRLYFEMANFDELVEAMNTMMEDKQAIKREVVLQPFLQQTPLAFNEDIPIRLRISNVGVEEIPAHSVIYFTCPTNYLIKHSVEISEAIPPRQFASIYVTLPVSGSASAKTLPDYIDIDLVDPSGKKIYAQHKRIIISSDFVTKSFEENTRTPLNVLIFGCIGAGKTSWINAVLTALSPQVQNRAIVGDSGGHGTEDLVKFSVWEGIEGIPKIKINFWDTWGVTLDNYENPGLFPALLDGQLPAGYHMKQRTPMNTLKNLTTQPTTFHAVLLFVPWDINQQKQLTEKMHEVFKTASKKGFNPLVIVTHIDKIQNETLRQMIKTDIASLFKIPENRIHMVQNYVKESAKNFAIDKQNLIILDEVIRMANNKVVSRGVPAELIVAFATAIVGLIVAFFLLRSNNTPAPKPQPKPQPKPMPIPVQESLKEEIKEEEEEEEGEDSEEETEEELEVALAKEEEVVKSAHEEKQPEESENEEENDEEGEVKEPEDEIVEEAEILPEMKKSASEDWVLTGDKTTPENEDEAKKSDNEEEPNDPDHRIVEVKIISGASRQFKVGKTTTVGSLLSQSLKVFASPSDNHSDYYLSDQKGAVLVEKDKVWKMSSPFYLNKLTSA